jgi:hypothetical protein
MLLATSRLVVDHKYTGLAPWLVSLLRRLEKRISGIKKARKIRINFGMAGSRTRTPFRAADFRTTMALATASSRLWSGLCLDPMSLELT